MRIPSPCTLKWMRGGTDINPATDFIRQHYFQTYGAKLSNTLPHILILSDSETTLRAACGIMPAGRGTLFLENYLNTPAELAMRTLFDPPPARAGIVEIGNFAATDGASARVMYAAVCLLLNHYGFRHIVFTGTVKIRNIFSRMNLHPVYLAEAKAESLSAGSDAWGSYYHHAPQVMAGELAGGQKALASQSLLLNLFPSLPSAPWQQEPEVYHAH